MKKQQNSQPAVAIVVPVYNIEEYISECIESILNQTYRNFRLFLIDDATPDNSGIICDQYAKKDQRITVIHKKQNAGLPAARASGVSVARRARLNYISFIDGDDYVRKQYISTLMKAFSNREVDISISGYYSNIRDKDAIRLSEQRSLNGKALNTRSLLKHMLVNWRDDGIMTMWGKIFKTELFNDMDFPTFNLGEDQAVMYKVYYKATKAVFYSKQIYHYRIREGSLTTAASSYNKVADILSLIKDCHMFFSDEKTLAAEKNIYLSTLLWWAFTILAGVQDANKNQIHKINNSMRSAANNFVDAKTLPFKARTKLFLVKRLPLSLAKFLLSVKNVVKSK